MLTFTEQKTLYQTLTEDSSQKNQDLFDVIINEKNRNILSSYNWPFLERSADISTVASQQFYNVPYNYKKGINVTVTVGTTKYSPIQAPNRAFWDNLNSTTSQTSDFPQYWFEYNGKIGIFPTPSSSSNTITVNYKVRVKDLSLADYTTGTITTATNGSTAIVGDSTVWTPKMAGLSFRIDDSLTANTGDGEWYEIASITDNTNLVLLNEYQGISIAAGSATYTIGQISQLPEDYHLLPVYEMVEEYWDKEGDRNRADKYNAKSRSLRDAMENMFGAKSENPVINIEGVDIQNPNLYIEE